MTITKTRLLALPAVALGLTLTLAACGSTSGHNIHKWARHGVHVHAHSQRSSHAGWLDDAFELGNTGCRSA